MRQESASGSHLACCSSSQSCWMLGMNISAWSRVGWSSAMASKKIRPSTPSIVFVVSPISPKRESTVHTARASQPQDTRGYSNRNIRLNQRYFVCISQGRDDNDQSVEVGCCSRWKKLDLTRSFSALFASKWFSQPLHRAYLSLRRR